MSIKVSIFSYNLTLLCYDQVKAIIKHSEYTPKSNASTVYFITMNINQQNFENV